MATERKLEILITQKGGDKVQDVIKKIKIEGVSTKKLMQEIVDDIPQVNSTFEASFKKLSKNIQEQNEDAKNRHFGTVRQLLKSVYGSDESKELEERFKKLTVEGAKLTFTMQQIQNLNEKAYKTLKDASTAKLTANQAEVDGLSKNTKSLQQLIGKYEERKKLLAEQAEIAKTAISAEYDEMKKAGADAVFVEKQKAEQILAIDNKLKESQKENSKNYQEAAKAYNDRLIKSFTAGMVVTVDKSAKKIEKEARKTKEKAKEMAAEIEKELKLPKGALNDIAEAALKTQQDSKAATTEANKTAQAAAKTTETVAKATEAATKTTEAAAKATEAAKEQIDISTSHKKIGEALEALKKYRKDLVDSGKEIISGYDAQIAAASGNTAVVKKLEAEKAEAVKYFGTQITKVQKDITDAEKKDQSLRMEQWRQWVQNVSSLITEISKTSGQVTKNATSVMDTYIKAKDAEITVIGEKYKIFQGEHREEIEKGTAITKELTELEAKKATAAANNNQEEVASIQAKIDAKKEENKQSLEMYAEDQRMQKEKQKKEDELNKKKMKWQRVQRKVELSQNIAAGTANVAEAVTKALAAGPIIGKILAAITAAQGAAQIVIMSRQMTKVEDGGLLRGKRHVQGGMRIEGTNIEVEGGEYVVNRVSTDKNMELIRYINSQRRELTPTDISAFFAKSSQSFEPPFSRAFQSGGQLPVVESPNTVDQEYILEAIRSIRIQPRVAVTDINRMQEEMVSVDNWVGL